MNVAPMGFFRIEIVSEFQTLEKINIMNISESIGYFLLYRATQTEPHPLGPLWFFSVVEKTVTHFSALRRGCFPIQVLLCSLLPNLLIHSQLIKALMSTEAENRAGRGNTELN